MSRKRIHITGRMTVETYLFSDYISCVEVYDHQGVLLSSFCMDRTVIEESQEHPELLIELCLQHLNRHPFKHETKEPLSSIQNRQRINAEFEVEFFDFSDSVQCVNVFSNGAFVTSFCSDYASMDEWQLEPCTLLPTIHQLLKTS